MMKIAMICIVGMFFLTANADLIDPVTKLKSAYSSSQIVFLGTSNHLSPRAHQVVLKFLESVSEDPHLRMIVLERTHELASAYKTLSTHELSLKELSKITHKSKNDLQFGFCGLRAEGAWFDREVLQFARKINLKRSKDQALLVIPTDGITLSDERRFQNDLKNEGSGIPVTRGNCDYIQFKNAKFTDKTLDILTTANRERKSAQSFSRLVWSKLNPQDKVVVLYHFGHLLKDFESCQAESKDGKSWKSFWSKTAWLNYFLTQTPKAKNKIKVVLLDEALNSQNPSGVLESNENLSGVELFKPDSFFRMSYLGGQHRSKAVKNFLFDEIIKLPLLKAEESIAKPQDSWPEMCTIN